MLAGISHKEAGSQGCRMSRDGPLAQQQSRKLTPALPATRSGDGKIQERKITTEIRLDPFFSPQSLQPRTSSLQPEKLQTQSLRRLGRVAPTRGLKFADYGGLQTNSFPLTMPEKGSVRALKKGCFRWTRSCRDSVGWPNFRRGRSFALS